MSLLAVAAGRLAKRHTSAWKGDAPDCVRTRVSRQYQLSRMSIAPRTHASIHHVSARQSPMWSTAPLCPSIRNIVLPDM